VRDTKDLHGYSYCHAPCGASARMLGGDDAWMRLRRKRGYEYLDRGAMTTVNE
jgi:hypothetical protein